MSISLKLVGKWLFLALFFLLSFLLPRKPPFTFMFLIKQVTITIYTIILFYFQYAYVALSNFLLTVIVLSDL